MFKESESEVHKLWPIYLYIRNKSLGLCSIEVCTGLFFCLFVHFESCSYRRLDKSCLLPQLGLDICTPYIDMNTYEYICINTYECNIKALEKICHMFQEMLKSPDMAFISKYYHLLSLDICSLQLCDVLHRFYWDSYSIGQSFFFFSRKT